MLWSDINDVKYKYEFIYFPDCTNYNYINYLDKNRNTNKNKAKPSKTPPKVDTIKDEDLPTALIGI